MRLKFIRNIFGDDQVYINYLDLEDFLYELETDAKTVTKLTNRERAVVAATVQSIREQICFTRNRSGV